MTTTRATGAIIRYVPFARTEIPTTTPRATNRVTNQRSITMSKRKRKSESESKFYSLQRLLDTGADYNIVFGERSNGKTYAALLHGLQNYVTTGEQMAYVRRWREDVRGKRADTLFSGHVQNGVITELTGGKYNEVFYLSGKWFLSYYNADTKKRTPDANPFCYAFALSEVEHDKSTSYPNVTTVVFDEFITRRYYLPDEFVIFMNVLSTIIRQRDNVRVYMLGNTVNKFCPYFAEMGLNNVDRMEQGTVDVYKFGEHGATIAVEYAAATEAAAKPSNKYFCFDNKQLEMITGGKWELAIYPHLPTKYKPSDILLTYFIDFNGQLLQGEIIQTGEQLFTYIHRKTTPLIDGVLTYSLTPRALPWYRRKLLSTATKLETRVARFFATEKVFYQDNEVGEIVRNYIIVSSKNNVLTV